MTAETRLRWGILGCARIARRGLIPGIIASQTGTVVALASRGRTTARTWAQEFHVPKAHGSYEALLADPEVEAVYIPLPNELHRPWVLAAADSGKHVLCEKPLALDAREAAAMVEHCEKRGVLLMEAFMWRHQPRTSELLKLVRGGEIGDLRLIRSSFSFPIEPGDWRLDQMRGGGALFDVGCYAVNTARLFAGSEPARPRAVARFSDTGVDLSAAATLEFPDGVLAVIDCSFEQPYRCSYELVGSSGVIDVPDAYLPPASGKPTARLRTIGMSSNTGARGDKVRTLEFDAVNQYAAMVDAFAHSVEAGSLIEPAENGLAQMQVLDRLATTAGASAISG